MFVCAIDTGESLPYGNCRDDKILQNRKEVKAMKYSFQCPAPCSKEIKVDAVSDDEAINKLMTAGKVHAKEAHPNMPAMSEQQMKDMVKAGMKKG
jgi:hypothetical protein